MQVGFTNPFILVCRSADRDRGYILVCDDESWKWVERGMVMVVDECLGFLLNPNFLYVRVSKP